MQRLLFGIVLGVVAITVTLTSLSLHRGDGASAVGPTPTKIHNSTPATSRDTIADRVFGQGGSFTTNACNNGGISASSLCNGDNQLTVDGSGNVYIADGVNNRVLEYDSPDPSTPIGPEMGLRLAAGGYCEPLDSTDCFVHHGNRFIVSLDALVVPDNGYVLAQGWVSYGDDLGGAVQGDSAAWPDCQAAYFTINSDQGGNSNLDSFNTGCLTGLITQPVSFHVGSLFTFMLTCSNFNSVNVLELIPNLVEPAGTFGALFTDADSNQVVPDVSQFGQLSITCQNLSKQSEPGDSDGDGCSDQKEQGPDETLGGQRNFLNAWDYYDMNGDSIIDLSNDIFEVIQHYAPTGSELAYSLVFDRGPSSGPDVWNMTAPDGVIDLSNDILGVIQQYLHDCR